MLLDLKSRFNPNHASFGAILRYVNGGKIPVAPMQLFGTEAGQMKSDLADPDFNAAVLELGYRTSHTEDRGILRVWCYHKRDLPVETPLEQAA